jgi:hypothetical protein
MTPAKCLRRALALFAAAGLAVATVRAAAPALPPCDDATFLRRASLDLVGRQPPPEEIEAFLADRSPGKREAAVERLLADPAWATNWARYFRDVILSRRSDERAVALGPAVEAFFAGHLAGEAAWDEIAHDVITATGVPSENGGTAIIMAQMGETSDIAAEVSRVFTGVQIQCAQCHDHFTDRWKRPQFHEFAAFFPRIAIRRGPGDGMERFEVVSFDRDPRGARGKKAANNPRRGDLEHEMPHLDDPSLPGTVMQPRFFLGGGPLPLGTPDQERRAMAARLVTAEDNPWFARAIVNRVWTELVGDGFYEGIDDLGPDREPRSPELLAELCRRFVAADHDLRALFRDVMATPAYRAAARSRGDAGRPVGSASCPQRLRADQLFTQVLAALGVEEGQVAGRLAAQAGGKGGGRRQVGLPRIVFNQTFGYDPGLPRDEILGSIPQALLLMNSQPLARAIDGERRFTLLGRLLADTPDDRELADELHLRTLARHATPAEITVCLEHVRDTGDRADAFEDIFWALVNSAEFIHRK